VVKLLLSVTPSGAEGQADPREPVAFWQTFEQPSVAMAYKIKEFEASEDGFVLSAEQRAACKWFGEQYKIPLEQRKQRACLLIGAGGTGKTIVILQLMLKPRQVLSM